MKAFVRGAAVLITTAALFGGAASAQDKTVLANDREKSATPSAWTSRPRSSRSARTWMRPRSNARSRMYSTAASR
ncbi:hypothetical protein [Lysobacter gummosus]|uniref:hypothetical protein n=1 Tax=Lysobacter gummosus TaxID=262324 RepID=UPI00363AF4E6